MATAQEETDLAQLIDEYLRFVFARDPIAATELGLHDHDRELGDYSGAAYAGEIAQREHFLTRFESVDRTQLGADAAMDLDVALIDVRTSLRRLTAHSVWTSAPYWVVERLGAAYSSVMRGDADQNTLELGEALRARLAQTPAYLAQAQADLDPDVTAPLHVEMGLTAVNGLLHFLEEAVPGFAARMPEDLQAAVIRAAGDAQQAVDEFAPFLQEFQSQARGHFACGPALFDFLLRELHGLEMDHRALAAFGEEQMAADKAALEAYARELDPARSWWELIEIIKDDHPLGESFLRAYQRELERARAHCVAADLVTLPEGEFAQVLWLPAYLRAGAPLGLMFTTPPFAPGLESELMLTPLDEDAPPEQQRQHMRDNCYAFARAITLHEIYPGHHIQQVHHKLATAHSPMRRTFSSPIFVEGWGLYTEDLMEETGFMDDPAVRLFKLRNALWRSARVVVDSGLHTRGMGFDEAVTLLVDEVHLDRRMAEGEVRRYTTHSNPTYPSAYLLGKTAIHKLREEWRARQGDAFSLRRFHDTLLGYGSPPVKLVAARMAG